MVTYREDYILILALLKDKKIVTRDNRIILKKILQSSIKVIIKKI